MTAKTYIIIILSLQALGLCIWVEVLNVKHGNYLPRTDIYEGGNNKWRDLSTGAAKKFWRKKSLFHITEDFLTVELTSEQKEKQEEYLAFNRSRIFFHELVGYAIVLYLILPITTILSMFGYIKVKVKKEKIAIGIMIVTQIVSYYLMFSRDYFTAIMA